MATKIDKTIPVPADKKNFRVLSLSMSRYDILVFNQNGSTLFSLKY